MRYLIFLLLLPIALAGQQVEDNLPLVSRCLAITNAQVISKAGQPMARQTIIIRDGLISETGTSPAIPGDAFIVKGDSFFIYPAFIDALSYTGIAEPEQENRRGGNAEKPPVDEEGYGTPEAMGITPGNSIRSSFKPGEKSISEWRNTGFAISHVVPRGRMIPGKGSIVLLSGTNSDQMIWKENTSLYGQWSGAGGMYPNTIIAVMSKWRELYTNSKQWLAHEKLYASQPNITRPDYQHVHAELAPLVENKIPLFFRASSVKDISRAISLQKDLGMRMIIADAKEADLLIPELVQTGIPVVLSSGLPEDKNKEKEEKPKKEEGEKKEADETKKEKTDEKKEIKTAEQLAFEARRAETLKRFQQQAATLSKSNVPFSISTLNTKSADFYKNIRTMIDQGLSTDKALEALTLQPARLLGIEKYCGSIEKGKMANLIITSEPLFDKEMNIRYMVVDGTLYKLDAKAKKKSGSKSELNIAGTWSFVVELPDGPANGTFEFKKSGDSYSGTMTYETDEDFDGNLDEIQLDGNTLSFTNANTKYNVVISFNLKVDGETITGTASSPFGSNEIHGQRISSPE